MNKLSVSNKKIDTILVLDFGSQYTQLIARRVRESDVYSEILPWDIDENKIIDINPKGIILSGGPNSVTDSYTPRIPQCVFDVGVPILGICYGMQTLAEQMGGHVISSDQKEFGHSKLEIINDSILFKDLDKKTTGFQKSDLVIVAGRPSMGKSALSINFVEHAIMSGRSALFFSLEMPSEQIVMRLLSSLGRIDQNRLRTGGGLMGEKASFSFLDQDRETSNQTTNIGMPINPYLWKASLETISFMPLTSTDPFAGTIITDWYTVETNQGERCKLNIFINGKDLKTDNLKVSSFCQILKNNQWVNVPSKTKENTKLENIILNGAKKLKLTSG